MTEGGSSALSQADRWSGAERSTAQHSTAQLGGSYYYYCRRLFPASRLSFRLHPLLLLLLSANEAQTGPGFGSPARFSQLALRPGKSPAQPSQAKPKQAQSEQWGHPAAGGGTAGVEPGEAEPNRAAGPNPSPIEKPTHHDERASERAWHWLASRQSTAQEQEEGERSWLGRKPEESTGAGESEEESRASHERRQYLIVLPCGKKG